MRFGNHYFWRLGCSLGLEGLNMINQIKEYLRLPSAKELAAKELSEAQRKLLDALSAQEYAKRMADYHSDRIKRLTAYLKDES
tara:strand:+ start:903 stop:1151 length:249 start_codon:yes stop_codon:yes gene_type:complete